MNGKTFVMLVSLVDIIVAVGAVLLLGAPWWVAAIIVVVGVGVVALRIARAMGAH